MRNIYFCILFASILLFSCNQEDKEPSVNILGYWDITRVNASWTGEVIIGEDIDFQERYIFNDDGTFIKFSTRNQNTRQNFQEPLQAFGIYELKRIADSGNLFEVMLTFETNVGMAVNCGGDVEDLILTIDNRLVNNSWAACDGASLVYEKKKN